MKKNIHPKYVETVVTCGCGETFKTRSTKPTIAVEICSKCHPFYTGRQKFVDSAGQVEKFQKKFAWTEDRAREVEKKRDATKAKAPVTPRTPRIRLSSGKEEEADATASAEKGKGRKGKGKAPAKAKAKSEGAGSAPAAPSTPEAKS